MPTAAKLVASICLAVLAFIISQMIKPLMPEGTNFGYFDVVNVVLGLIAGWIIMGPRAGQGMTQAINNGIAGVFMLILWGLFVQGCNEMVILAMRNRYKGPFEALLAIVEIGAEYALIMATPQIIATALIGALVSGFATEYTKARAS